MKLAVLNMILQAVVGCVMECTFSCNLQCYSIFVNMQLAFPIQRLSLDIRQIKIMTDVSYKNPEFKI